MDYNTVLFVPLVLVPIFSFVAAIVWIDARRRERDAHYRCETLKRISETTGGQSPLEFLREEDRIATRRQREGLKLGGLVTLAVGVALGIFLAAIDPKEPAYLVGLIPGLIGASLLGYGSLLAPKE